MYLVAYLKVCKPSIKGGSGFYSTRITLVDSTDDNVFYGGIADSLSDAEIIARECVNTTSGIILPRIFDYEPPPIGHDLPTALLLAEEWFEAKLHEMREAQANILHDKELYRKSRK